MSKTANLFSDLNDFINETVNEEWKRIKLEEGKGVSFNHRKLKKYTQYFKKETIRKAIKEVKGDLSDISYNHVEAVLDEITDPKPRSRLDLPGNLIFIKNRNFSEFRKDSEEKIEPFSYRVPAKGKKTIQEIGWKFELVSFKKEENIAFPEGRFEEYVDLEKISEPLQIRNRCEGDKFVPLGMKKKKKLKDFFIDEKIPHYRRNKVPILCDKKGIVWIVGFRLDNRYKVHDNTTHILKIKAEKI